MSKRSLPTEKKLEALRAYKEGIYPISEICSLYNIHESTFEKWRYNYEKYGVEGLKESNGWKKYSRELKLAAVLDYQSGQYSLMEVVRKYEISSDSV
ncbi:helix-turn-helix domain-containing protein, partial [Akkermansia muciniphila]